MNRLDLQLQDARRHYPSAFYDKTNRRLNVLTIVQSVFVSMTLIAGIYGMNFEWMPKRYRPTHMCCVWGWLPPSWSLRYGSFVGQAGLTETIVHVE